MTITTGKDLKKKLIDLDLTQQELAQKIGVTVGTVNTMCNKPTIPVLWQWAIYGLEFQVNKGVK